MRISEPPPKSKYSEIVIYLKSGQSIEISCEDWTFTKDGRTGEIIGYKFKGLYKPESLCIVPNQIAAYIVK